MARDASRERCVGREVVERQYQAFELAKSAIHQEGFDQVMEFREGDLDNVRIEIVFRPVVRHPQKPESAETRRPERPAPAGSRKSNGNGVPTSSAKLYRSGSAAGTTVPGQSTGTERVAAAPVSASLPSDPVRQAAPASSPASSTDTPAGSHSTGKS